MPPARHKGWLQRAACPRLGLGAGGVVSTYSVCLPSSARQGEAAKHQTSQGTQRPRLPAWAAGGVGSRGALCNTGGLAREQGAEDTGGARLTRGVVRLMAESPSTSLGLARLRRQWRAALYTRGMLGVRFRRDSETYMRAHATLIHYQVRTCERMRACKGTAGRGTRVSGRREAGPARQGWSHCARTRCVLQWRGSSVFSSQCRTTQKTRSDGDRSRGCGRPAGGQPAEQKRGPAWWQAAH